MFEKGNYVFYENKGVCVVDEVTHMDIPGADKNRLYYAMVPTGVKGSRIYSPVDNNKLILRQVMSKSEAEELIDHVGEIEEFQCANDKEQEAAYKEALRSCDPIQWIRIIKTLYTKKNKRAEDGKKITSTDGKYLFIVEDFLYGELSAALQIERDEAKELISSKINKKVVSEK